MREEPAEPAPFAPVVVGPLSRTELEPVVAHSAKHALPELTLRNRRAAGALLVAIIAAAPDLGLNRNFSDAHDGRMRVKEHRHKCRPCMTGPHDINDAELAAGVAYSSVRNRPRCGRRGRHVEYVRHDSSS